MLIDCASARCSFSSCGTNSCNGGSIVRIVTGFPFITSKMPAKSLRCNGRSFESASFRWSTVSARIISRIGPILPSPKNICSVRQRPIPSAPNAIAFAAWSGWSAFVRIFSVRYLSAHSITFSKVWYTGASFGLRVFSTSTCSTSDGLVWILPSITCPVEPSSEIQSPSFNTLPFTVIVCLA